MSLINAIIGLISGGALGQILSVRTARIETKKKMSDFYKQEIDYLNQQLDKYKSAHKKELEECQQQVEKLTQENKNTKLSPKNKHNERNTKK